MNYFGKYKPKLQRLFLKFYLEHQSEFKQKLKLLSRNEVEVNFTAVGLCNEINFCLTNYITVKRIASYTAMVNE